jgi:hypothetical protein
MQPYATPTGEIWTTSILFVNLIQPFSKRKDDLKFLHGRQHHFFQMEDNLNAALTN